MDVKNKTILLVEDDIDIRDLISELLQSEGYHVVAMPNGQEALDFLGSTDKNPNLILLDMMMPVKDGFQFRMEQRQSPKINQIPVVVMSADGNVAKKFQDQEVADYLKKPLDIDHLLDCVKKTAS